MVDDIHIIQWNAAGLPNKREFKQLLLQNDFDIACVQETHLRPGLNYNLTGYKVMRRDRDKNVGGGVAIIIKNYITILQVKTFPNDEAIQIDIKIKNNKKLSIINIYNPPGHALQQEFLNEIFADQHSTLVLGDFNAHSEMWYCKTHNTEGVRLADASEKFGYVLLNKKVNTRDNPIGHDSLLDLSFATPQLSIIATHAVVNSTFGSDHHPIHITIKLSAASPEDLGKNLKNSIK